MVAIYSLHSRVQLRFYVVLMDNFHLNVLVRNRKRCVSVGFLGYTLRVYRQYNIKTRMKKRIRMETSSPHIPSVAVETTHFVEPVHVENIVQLSDVLT